MGFKLIDVVSAATATVALVIGSSIFLQILANKSTAIYERYRGLTGEYRENKEGPERRRSLEAQITWYYQRCHSIRHASTALIVAVLCFVATIVDTSFAVMFPDEIWLKYTGATVLILGLFAMTIGALIEMRENFMSARVIESEIADFPNLPKRRL